MRICPCCGATDHWHAMRGVEVRVFAGEEARQRAGTRAEIEDLSGGAEN